MSTKILDGFRFPTKGTIELMEWLAPLRTKMQNYAEEAHTTEMIKQASYFVDAKKLGLLPGEWLLPSGDQTNVSGKTGMSLALDIMADACRVYKSGKRCPGFDFSCDICIIPQIQYSLAIIYYEDEIFRNMFSEHPNVELYNYWDNTDKPKGISDEEWEERSDCWGDALGNWKNTPSECGFTVKMVNDAKLYLPTHKKIPSKVERAEGFASELAFKEIQSKNEKMSIWQIARKSRSGEIFDRYLTMVLDDLDDLSWDDLTKINL